MTVRTYATLPIADYVRDDVNAPAPTLNASVAHLLLTRSPLHAARAHPKLSVLPTDEGDARFDLGTAAHALLLEGRDDLLAVGPWEDWRSKAAREFRDTAKAAGKIPLLTDQADSVRRMAEVALQTVLASPDLTGVDLTSFQAEMTIVFQHAGAWLRCRPDWLTADRSLIVSYKTTSGSAQPSAFGRALINFGYDLQAAFELAAVRALTGRDAHYVWLAQEASPPYACSLLGLSPMFLDLAMRKLQTAAELWQACLSTNAWPGYPEKVAYVDPPAWAMYEWGERHPERAPVVDDGRPLDEQLAGERP